VRNLPTGELLTEPVVRFQPLGKRIAPREGASLLDLAREAGVSIESICGSAGKCGKCRVVISSGQRHLTEPTSAETKALGKDALSSGERLACQSWIAAVGDIIVEVPEESRRGHHRLLASGEERSTTLNPAVRKSLVSLPPATLEDVRSDDDRLMDVLKKHAKARARISPGAHRSLPSAIREGSWQATVTLFMDKEVIRVEPGDTGQELLGVAVDVGTTKIVTYLVDLISGETKATESMPNPQIPFGEDVMSRITYAARNDHGQEKLQKAVVTGVNELIARTCRASGIEKESVLEVMIVGNTAMHHLFFGIPAKHLASAPYAPAVRTSVAYDAGLLGMDIYPFGKVSSLPNIAGFVGADAVAGLVSSGLYRDKKIGMMIDIGTNTEIIAGNKDRLVSCSCASGPAFEGAHIKSGMRASTGAIERVWIDPSSLDVRLRTVDDAKPRGICGSGIVDAIAEMFRTGLIDSSGRIADPSMSPRIRKGESGSKGFVLAHSGETENGADITITQHDIEEIQLAKAAIFTGVSMLMRRLGIAANDIQRVYAAGAFGTYVDAASAITIGMYPDVPTDRIRFVGNSAGSGARMALKSVKIRELAERLSKRVEYVELAAEKGFQNEFAKAMFLPNRDKDRFPSVKNA
jgi:uncharacterized 2Fe-2S/4Fe-4S cluster protein (DUF4445 family)